MNENEFGIHNMSEKSYRLLAVQFCTNLLAAGVLKPMEEEDFQSDGVFKAINYKLIIPAIKLYTIPARSYVPLDLH